MFFDAGLAIKKCVLPILGVILLLNGCASKQIEQPEVILPAKNSSHTSSLTAAEIKALKTTGQIDRDVPDHAFEDVAKQYKHFLRKGRATVCAFSRRSEQYLDYARKVFRERGMPEELANLAIVESGYKSDAVSHAGAVGAWQFMAATGQSYGLQQDWWQDDRLDPYRATEAAASYLQKLYNDFGDWPTAIAAYNAGEGKISRAKAGTGGKDFFEVKALNHMLEENAQLKDETKNYVPRFIAVTKIMRNLPDLGFDAIEPEKAPQVARLKAAPGTDLQAVSRACNMSWTEFRKYNLHHKRNITCTDKHTYVYVPANVENLAARYLEAHQKSDFAGWQPVKVASSKDSLEKISKRSKISLASLQTANPGINRLKAGQVILAPLAINLSPRAREIINGGKVAGKTSKTAALDAPASGQTHLLKTNETLYAVARRYDVSVTDLMRHNSITEPASIKSGQTLRIPSKGKTSGKGGSRGSIGTKARRSSYTVQAKDNLWSIARRHNISVTDLKRWNKVDEKTLRPGTTLVIAEE